MKIEGSINAFTSQSLNNNINVDNVEAIKNTNIAESNGHTEKNETQENSQYEMQLSAKAIESAIETANKKLEPVKKKFEYSIHEGTNEIMVKIIDKETDEVIKEIPSEKILDMVAKMFELVGLFVDEKR